MQSRKFLAVLTASVLAAGTSLLASGFSAAGLSSSQLLGLPTPATPATPVTRATTDGRATSWLTIPAVRQANPLPREAEWTLTSTTRIVVKTAAYRSAAVLLASELEATVGRPVEVLSVATPTGADIVMSAVAAGALPPGGYGLDASATRGLTIYAPTSGGAFYGTRTLLQLLRQSRSIRAVQIRDWPVQQQRSIMFDTARKPYSLAFLQAKVREAAWLKYNTIHLHLTDDNGWTVQSDLVPAAYSLTKEQMRSLVSFAARYHITIVPEIDMPAHATQLLADHPEYQLPNGDGRAANVLDVTSSAARFFAKRIFDEYVDLFPGKQWHIGGDEIPQTPDLVNWAQAKWGPSANGDDALVDFVNDIAAHARARGKTIIMWGNDYARAGVVKLDPSVQLEAWNEPENVRAAVADGRSILNATFYPNYYVLGWEQQHWAQYADTAQCRWNPRDFYGYVDPTTAASSTPQPTYTIPANAALLGGEVPVWGDNGSSQTEQQVTWGLRTKLRCASQQLWGSSPISQDPADVDTFDSRIGIVPGNADDVGPNIARGKAVTAERAEGLAWAPWQAVDGDRSTYWAAGPAPSWLQIDLGTIHDIASVNVQTYDDGTRAYTYDVQLSDNARDWATVDRKTSSRPATPQGDTWTLRDALTGPQQLDTARARYVRIVMQSNTANPSVHIREVAVHGQPRTDPGTDTQDVTFARRVVQLVNQERTSRGLQPMREQPALTAAAVWHSEDMASRGYFSHGSLDGDTAAQRAVAAGYWTDTVSENIAAGSRTPEDVMTQWMNSPGHRQAILEPGNVEIGVGVAGAGGPWPNWTQVLSAFPTPPPKQ